MSDCPCTELDYDDQLGCEVCTTCGVVKSETQLVAPSGFDGYRSHDPSKHYAVLPYPSQEKVIQFIQKLAEKNAIDNDTRESGIEMLKQLYTFREYKFLKFTTKMTSGAYCLYIACRHANVPITFTMLLGEYKDEVNMHLWISVASRITRLLNTTVRDPPLNELVNSYVGKYLDKETIVLTNKILEILLQECDSVACSYKAYINAAAYIAWKARDPHKRSKKSPPYFWKEVLHCPQKFKQSRIFHVVTKLLFSYLDEIPWFKNDPKLKPTVQLAYYINDITENIKLYKFTRDSKRKVPSYESLMSCEAKRVSLIETEQLKQSEYLKSKYDLDSEVIEEDLMSDRELDSYIYDQGEVNMKKKFKAV